VRVPRVITQPSMNSQWVIKDGSLNAGLKGYPGSSDLRKL
jgi:hypothetical protein